MNKCMRNFIYAFGLALTVSTGSSVVLAEATVSQDITDARQETQIWTTYLLSPYLRASDLKVSVSQGKATLSGKVSEDVSKELAQQIAKGVSGIKDVDNQIKVDEDHEVDKSSVSTYADMVDDASITTVVKSKLLWSKNIDAKSIKVETLKGKVKLTGDTNNRDAKELAGRLATNTRGVVSVDNQLMIKEVKPGSVEKATEGTGQVISDSWITTKVKTTFMYSSNVNSSDISVTTKDGVVSLTGKVDSGAEQALAVEFAQNVRGVKSVDAKGLTSGV